MVKNPKRLKSGDEVRIIAPARSLSLISDTNINNAVVCLKQYLGLKVSFSKNVYESDVFISSSIASRVNDIHDAFSDQNVKGILTVIGGYNSNQLLGHLDYELIKNNPKILCGYSDITALANAIYRKTGMTTFSGPHFSTFGCLEGIDYIKEYFKKCLMADGAFAVHASPTWSDDEWYLDQSNRTFLHNDGIVTINQGSASGTIVGGNLCTLNLLHGTEYMPDLSDTILFVEDDFLVFPEIFDRDLQSLIMQPGFSGVKGMVIGRFQRASKMSIDVLKAICHSKRELKNIPIIANADFGHTMPMFTFPIGGIAKLDTHLANPVMTLAW